MARSERALAAALRATCGLRPQRRFAPRELRPDPRGERACGASRGVAERGEGGCGASGWVAELTVVVLALACGGCDLAFGLDEGPEACELSSFESAASVDLINANDFSVDWDQRFAVVIRNGAAFELELPNGLPLPIDLLGLYVNDGMAMTPEGNAMLYTSLIEPPILNGALRASAGSWTAAPAVPRGTFAGTPSADVLGPRRILVKMRQLDVTVQEYEDDSGRWVTVGEPHDLVATLAPNLTPNGLTMVYSGFDEAGAPAVLGATRATTSEWFGPPTVLLAGDHHSAQLLGQCKQLYTIHYSDEMGAQLRRYDR